MRLDCARKPSLTGPLNCRFYEAYFREVGRARTLVSLGSRLSYGTINVSATAMAAASLTRRFQNC